MSRVTASATLEVVSAKMDALTAAIHALVSAQSHAVVTPTVAVVPANVPTQTPAVVEMAEPYVPAKPATVVSVEPVVAAATGKKVLPSAAVYRMDGALWVAFPAMDACHSEADFLFGKLKAYPWFVTHDSKGNASAKKSLKVLPFIYDKRKGDSRPGPLSNYSGGHSCHIGSFDRAPAFKQVAALIDGFLAEYRAAKVAAPVPAKPATVKVAPVALPDNMPVFA